MGLQDAKSQSGGAEVVRIREDHPKVEPFTVVRGLKLGLFTLALFLSVIEHLSRTANVLSIERDWVPTMAAPVPGLQEDKASKFGLAQLNAVMSRIDLICKLLSPIAMSAFISAVGSTRIGIVALLALNAATWSIEIWTATRVWTLNRQLREPKALDPDDIGPDDLPAREEGHPSLKVQDSKWQRSQQRVYEAFQSTNKAIRTWLRDYRANVSIYFGYPVWLASMALSTLHFSVLNYSPTLTVYLLGSDFPMNFVTAAKALSAVAEIASTFFTPWSVRTAGRIWSGHKTIASDLRDESSSEGAEDVVELLSEHDPEERGDEHTQDGTFAPETDMGVAVLGLWSLIQMFLSLVGIAFLMPP